MVRKKATGWENAAIIQEHEWEWREQFRRFYLREYSELTSAEKIVFHYLEVLPFVAVSCLILQTDPMTQ